LYNPLALIVKEMDLLTLFINLTPFIPLSFEGEGEEVFREGLRPSLTYTPPFPY